MSKFEKKKKGYRTNANITKLFSLDFQSSKKENLTFKKLRINRP